jgi:hypothetical protein
VQREPSSGDRGFGYFRGMDGQAKGREGDDKNEDRGRGGIREDDEHQGQDIG